MSIDQTTIYSSETVSQPVVSAEYDINILDSGLNEADESTLMDTNTSSAGTSTILELWVSVLELLNTGQLTHTDPQLLALVDALVASGVLPDQADDMNAFLQGFHAWFLSMDATGTYSDLLTVLEAKILVAWAQQQVPSPFDQVIAFDALNMFNQYTSYCQVVMGEEVITLSYFSSVPVAYDASSHSSFGILYHHQWQEPMPSNGVDYSQAHDQLTLSEADQLAIQDFIDSLFEDDPSGLTDEEIIFIVMSALQSDAFEYQVDIGDQWESMAQFLQYRTGDCEEFSHLLYATLSAIYNDLPDRSLNMQMVAGMMGSGLNQFGHSVVEIELNGTVYILDPSGGVIESMDDVLTTEQYQEINAFEQLIRYDLLGTDVLVDESVLQTFSTATSIENTLNAQFQLIFGVGDDVSFDSVISNDDDDAFSIDSYDDLIQKVIALEMQRAIESGQPGIFALSSSDLESEYNFNLSQFNLEFSDEQLSQINDVLNEIRLCNEGNEPVNFSGLDFLTEDDEEALLSQLIQNGILFSYNNLHWLIFGSGSSINSTNIWNQLIEYGFITEMGMIDLNVLSDLEKQDALRQWFFDNAGSVTQADELIALMESRVVVFSSATGEISTDPFENALMSFETLTEELLIGLTAPATPIYANPELNGAYTMVSPYVIGGYDSNSSENSLFIRIDHQQLQQSMSRFFSLQNTISAFMTVAFSMSDMISSLSSKLGNSASTAKSTAKQRQKIIQSFNTYSSGINESLTTLMDLFQHNIETTNQSRYQTAITQLDLEYSDVGSQLSNAFLANEAEIASEGLKAELSQDYYDMLFDNRQSMQQAMIDVPQFGPNILPSQFSHLLMGQEDEYGDLSSTQIWSALFASEVIDIYGNVIDGFDLTTIDLSKASLNAFETASASLNDPSGDYSEILGFLRQQVEAFETNTDTLDLTQLNGWVSNQLQTHQESVNSPFVFSLNQFDTSQYWHNVMNMMEHNDELSANEIDFSASASIVLSSRRRL